MMEEMKMSKKIIGYAAAVSALLLFAVLMNYADRDLKTDETFDAEILNNGEVSVLAFTAPHCNACKNQKHILNNLRSEITDDAVFEYIDVTKQTKAANYYEIAIVPTLVITRYGIEVNRFTGFRSKVEIKKSIEKKLGKEYCFDGTPC